MKKSEINDLTDAFDTRLQSLQRHHAPAEEQAAAIAVYERVRTARSICQALLTSGFTDASVVALAVELGRVAQAAQGPSTAE